MTTPNTPKKTDAQFFAAFSNMERAALQLSNPDRFHQLRTAYQTWRQERPEFHALVRLGKKQGRLTAEQITQYAQRPVAELRAYITTTSTPTPPRAA